MASTPCSTASNCGASRKNKPQSGKYNIFNLQQYTTRIFNYLVELGINFLILEKKQFKDSSA